MTTKICMHGAAHIPFNDLVLSAVICIFARINVKEARNGALQIVDMYIE